MAPPKPRGVRTRQHLIPRKEESPVTRVASVSTYPARHLGIHPRDFESSWMEADDESNTWMTSMICEVASFQPNHLEFAHGRAENEGVLVFIYERADEKEIWRALEHSFNGSKPLCFTVGLYCVFIGIHNLCQSRAEPRFEIWSGRNLFWSHDGYIAPISVVHEIEICWLRHLQRIKRKIPECLDYSFSLSEGIKIAREKKKFCMVYLQGPTRYSWKVNRGSVVWLKQSGLFNDANLDVICEWCIFVHLAEDTVEGTLYLTMWNHYTVRNDLPTLEKQKPIIALLDHNEGDFLWYSFDKEICKQADVEKYREWFQGVSSKMVGRVYRPIDCSEESINVSRFRARHRDKHLLFFASGMHCACNAIEKSLFQDLKVGGYLNRYAYIRKIAVGSTHFLELLEECNYEDISAPALFILDQGFLRQFPLGLSELRIIANCDFLNAFTENLSMTNNPTQRMVIKTSESYLVDNEIKIAPKKKFLEPIWKTIEEKRPRFSKFPQHPNSFREHFMQVEARPTWMTERVKLVKDKADLKTAVRLARNEQLLLLIYYRGNDEDSKWLEANCNKSRPLCYTVGLYCHYVMAEDVLGFETDGPRFEIWDGVQQLWSHDGFIDSLSLVFAIETYWMQLLERTKGKLPEDWNVNFSMSEGMNNAKRQDKVCLVYYEEQPGLSLKQNKGSVISMKRHRLDKDVKLADMILKHCIFIHIVKGTLSGYSYKIMWDNYRIKTGITSKETPIMAILQSDGRFLWYTWVNSKEMRTEAASFILCCQLVKSKQVHHVDKYVDDFDGSPVEASSRAKEENKHLVIFVSGGDSVSSAIEQTLWEDKQVSDYFRNQVIYMRLISGSEDFRHFRSLQYADIAVPCILCLDNGEISHKLPLGIIELKEAIKVLKDDNVEPFKEKPIDIKKVVRVNQSTIKGRSKVNIIQKNDSTGAYKKKPEHNKTSPKKTRSAYTEYYNQQFPVGMQPYIRGAYDVQADGNCGYRVVASAMEFGQESWCKVRRDLLNELHSEQRFYANIFGETEFERVQQALEYFDLGIAPKKHWMSFPEMGHLIATCYGVVVINISNSQCITFFPLMEREIGQLSNTALREIGIGQVNGNHFVHLNLSPGHPLPNLVPNWERIADIKVQHLLSVYQDRIYQYRLYQSTVSSSHLVSESFTLDD